MRDRCGLLVEVLPAQEETRLAYVAALAGLDVAADSVVVFDTGGGSTQFTFSHGPHIEDGFSVVAHLYSSRRKHSLLLRTRVPREDPVVESVVELFPGSAWHERETYEMFGITFARHPDLKPLLLPPGFEGNPLRKEFVLASRVAKAWPGAKEPGESESGTAKRAPMRPPGVPDPNEWGPKAKKDAD